jgi:hypothetical protein
MSPADDEAFMRLEYDKLRDEILSLKHCQVQLIHLAILALAAICSAVGFVLSKDSPSPSALFAGLMLATLLPGIMPMLAWMLVHKSRSAFRCIAWTRIIDCFRIKDSRIKGKAYQGYENSLAIIRKCAWSNERVGLWDSICGKGTPAEEPFAKRMKDSLLRIGRLMCMILPDWPNAMKYANLCAQCVVGQGGEPASHVTKQGGVGMYYSVVTFMLLCFGGMGLLLAALLELMLLMNSRETPYPWVGIIVLPLLLLYLLVSIRYLVWQGDKELKSFPYSIQAHFEMFLCAITKPDCVGMKQQYAKTPGVRPENSGSSGDHNT